MIEDDLVKEVRAARDEYCRRFNYDLKAIFQDLQEQQAKGGRKVVNLAPRRPTPTNRESDGDPA